MDGYLPLKASEKHPIQFQQSWFSQAQCLHTTRNVQCRQQFLLANIALCATLAPLVSQDFPSCSNACRGATAGIIDRTPYFFYFLLTSLGFVFCHHQCCLHHHLRHLSHMLSLISSQSQWISLWFWFRETNKQKPQTENCSLKGMCLDSISSHSCSDILGKWENKKSKLARSRDSSLPAGGFGYASLTQASPIDVIAALSPTPLALCLLLQILYLELFLVLGLTSGLDVLGYFAQDQDFWVPFVHSFTRFLLILLDAATLGAGEVALKGFLFQPFIPYWGCWLFKPGWMDIGQWEAKYPDPQVLEHWVCRKTIDPKKI